MPIVYCPTCGVSYAYTISPTLYMCSRCLNTYNVDQVHVISFPTLLCRRRPQLPSTVKTFSATIDNEEEVLAEIAKHVINNAYVLRLVVDEHVVYVVSEDGQVIASIEKMLKQQDCRDLYSELL